MLKITRWFMMMKYDNSFIIGISQKGLDNDFVLPVKVNFSSVPHLICVAPSGSGKTYALTYFLKQIAQKPVKLILADFKSIDFSEMSVKTTINIMKLERLWRLYIRKCKTEWKHHQITIFLFTYVLMNGVVIYLLYLKRKWKNTKK